MENIENEKKEGKLIGITTLIFLIMYFLFPEYARYEIVIYFVTLLCEYMLLRVKIYINTGIALWLLYIVVGVFGSIFYNNGENISESIEFAIVLLLGTLLFSPRIGSYATKWNVYAVCAVSVVSFLGCVMQLALPEVLSSFNKFHLGSEKFLMFEDFFRSKYIVGFSYQTAVTAFYLSILLGVLFILFVYEKVENKTAKLITLILMIICSIFIFMTAKRIFIVLDALILCFLYSIKNKKHAPKILFFGLLIVGMLWLLMNNTLVGARIIKRMESIDPTRGRNSIYEILISSFWETPIIGKGFGSTKKIVDFFNNGHNVYLQILSETGVVGFVLLVPMWFFNLFGTIRLLNRCVSEKVYCLELVFSLFVQFLFLGWCLTGNPLYDVYPYFIYMISVNIYTNCKKGLVI